MILRIETRLFQMIRDNYYDSNNSYFKKNKIELTNEKYRILSQLERFERSQAAHANTSNISYKLNSCSGLSDNEIVNDIHLLRNSIANKSIINEEEPDIIEPQTDTNEEDQEITEESLKQNYKQLLSMSSDTVSHPKPKSLRSILADSSPPLLATGLPKLNIPELPPLEAFPKLQNKSEERLRYILYIESIYIIYSFSNKILAFFNSASLIVESNESINDFFRFIRNIR